MREARTLTVSIACPADRVYAFVANPENLPQWAHGLGRSVRRSNGGWMVPNGSGSAVLVTLFRLPDMSDAQYAEDARLVERDLQTLKTILEA